MADELQTWASVTAAIVVPGAIAVVTYFLNERAKRNELRITQVAEKRLNAYVDAKAKVSRFISVLRAAARANGMRNRSRPVHDRIIDAGVLAVLHLRDHALYSKLLALIRNADNLPPARMGWFEKTTQALYTRVWDDLLSASEEVDAALYLCRLMAFDRELREKVRQGEKTLEDLVESLGKEDKAFGKRLDEVQDVLDEVMHDLAASYSRDFDGT